MFRVMSVLVAGIRCAGCLTMNAAVKVEKTSYKGWTNCWRVSNGDVELIVTGDVGPRIIRYGFVGGQNLFKEYSEQLGKSGEKEFQLRGGDRVWKAPEDPIATWAPDNVPVEITVTTSGLVARAPVEPTTSLQKEIEISMAPSGTQVTVSHRIWNSSLFTLEFSPWALTMMAPGGMAITGFPPRGSHLANLEATNPLVMWAYTDLSDKRLSFTKKYMVLRQDPANANAQKVDYSIRIPGPRICSTESYSSSVPRRNPAKLIPTSVAPSRPLQTISPRGGDPWASDKSASRWGRGTEGTLGPLPSY